MTSWHTVPQNGTESMYSTPRYAASDTMITLTIVSAKIDTATVRCVGLFRSSFGQLDSVAGRPSARRRRSRQAPSGMRPRPMRNSAGSTRKNTIPM